MDTTERTLTRTACMIAAAAGALALVAAGCGGGDEGGGKPKGGERRVEHGRPPGGRPGSGSQRISGPRVAARVAELRELKFDRVPKFGLISAEQSSRHFAKRAASSPRKAALGEEEGKLLGLIPRTTSARSLGSSLGGEAILGYYDPKTNALNLVRRSGGGASGATEGVLAHELTHALQEQKFDALTRQRKLSRGPDSDAATALKSVVEGDAKVIERRYTKRYGGAPDRGGQSATKGIPFAVLLQVAFPYDVGADFVAELVKKKGGYRAVNEALSRRPPVSTAQIIDPELYLRDVRPRPVKLRAGAALGARWKRRDAGTVGELDLITLLAASKGQIDSAKATAEGWAGGREEFYRRGAFPSGCAAPCVKRDVLVLGVRWRRAADAARWQKALGRALVRNRRAKPAGKGAWTVGGGAVAVHSGGGRSVTVYAPTVALARRVAARA